MIYLFIAAYLIADIYAARYVHEVLVRPVFEIPGIKNRYHVIAVFLWLFAPFTWVALHIIRFGIRKGGGNNEELL